MHPLGIDLGTTYSAISKWVNNPPRFIGSEPYTVQLESSPNLPSKVFLEEGEDSHSFMVGTQALKKGISHPEQLVTAVKRKMDDASHRYDLLGESYSPIKISSEIVKCLLRDVEGVEQPGTYVPKGVVVTVPHYFKQHQNVNTYNAALGAMRDLYENRDTGGREVEDLLLDLVAEPIAAGLDYAFQRDAGDGRENILVFDLGGGTFDVTIFSLEQKGSSICFEVKAVDGNDRLGGEDFDESLFEWIREVENIDLNALDTRVRRNAEKKTRPAVTDVKEGLTTAKRTDLIVGQAIGSQSIDLEVQRSNFEDCLVGESGDGRDYFDEVKKKVRGVLTQSGFKEDDITWVLMTGGSSRIPLFRQLIEDTFGENKCRDAGNVRLAVTRGAAIYAAYLLDEKLEQQGKPREHLALWDNIEIKEVTAHKLGVEAGGRFHVFMNDNEPTPRERTRTFEPTTLSDDGTRAHLDSIEIVQGDRSDYDVVGEVELDDIYTHGRSLEEMSILVTFKAHRNLVSVEVRAEGGSEDGSDYVKEGRLTLEENDEDA